MGKWISITAVTLASTVAACTASQQSFKVQSALSLDGKTVTDTGAAEYEKGKQLLSQRRFAAAAQEFQAALFAGGTSVKILNALAVSYDELGRYDLSDRYYQQAIILDPENVQTVNNLAVSLARRGAPDIAANVLASVQARLRDDKTLASNLNRAQAEARTGPTVVATAPSPVWIPNPPQVPRIEQTSPSTQQLITIRTAADVVKLPQATAAAPIISREVPTMAPAVADTTQLGTVDRFASRPAVISEPLAPPSPVAITESTAAEKIADGSPRTGSAPPAANHETIASVAAKAASQTARFEAAPAASEPPMLAWARSRLGSRIAESENIQPTDVAAQKAGATELAMERLGVRLEVANGAGRRYMAARMRSFLDSHGFDVAYVTNARSFDYVKTVIVYRDGFQPEAAELANTLATKVELLHVADLPVDVRLVLGRDLLPFDRTLERGG